jgi:hypothetical protein
MAGSAQICAATAIAMSIKQTQIRQQRPARSHGPLARRHGCGSSGCAFNGASFVGTKDQFFAGSGGDMPGGRGMYGRKHQLDLVTARTP